MEPFRWRYMTKTSSSARLGYKVVLRLLTLVINHQPKQKCHDILPGSPFGQEICKGVLQLPRGRPGLPSRRRLDLLGQSARRVDEISRHLVINDVEKNFQLPEDRKWGITSLLTYIYIGPERGPRALFRAAGASSTIGCQIGTRLRTLRTTRRWATRVRRLVLLRLG